MTDTTHCLAPCGPSYSWQNVFGHDPTQGLIDEINWDTWGGVRSIVLFNGREVPVMACKPGHEGWVLTDSENWPFLRMSDEPPSFGKPRFFFGRVECVIVLYEVRPITAIENVFRSE